MIEHIVAGGCSFTADGIGGIPPTPFNLKGACTFIPDVSYTPASPKTWAGFVAQQLQVKSLVNLAAEGHGNMLTANNIISVLTRFNYDPSTTIVLFNITDASRLDLICDWHSPDASPWCSWPETVLNFKYLAQSGSLVESVRKSMGIDQVETASSNALWGMISFLQEHRFNFKFLTMRDYSSYYPVNHTLSKLLDRYQAHWIQPNQDRGLIEYIQQLGLTVSSSDFHPTVNGHEKIAKCIVQNL